MKGEWLTIGKRALKLTKREDKPSTTERVNRKDRNGFQKSMHAVRSKVTSGKFDKLWEKQALSREVALLLGVAIPIADRRSKKISKANDNSPVQRESPGRPPGRCYRGTRSPSNHHRRR